jgi:hypothetical protein
MRVIDAPDECIDRSQECVRLARATGDDKCKRFLYLLAAALAQSRRRRF